MGFVQILGNNMAKRSRQYAIRSTYDLLPQKKKIRKTDIYSYYNIEQPKKSKKVKIPELPMDKRGATYGDEKTCVFQGKRYDIISVEGKMINLSDGKRHRLSSVYLDICGDKLPIEACNEYDKNPDGNFKEVLWRYRFPDEEIA